jgi:hypothetical protein
MLTINRHPSRAQLWWFARLWFPLVGGVMGLTVYWRIHAPTAAIWIWSATAVATAVSLTSEKATRLVFLGVSCAALPVGVVTGWITLALLYFAVLTPLGFVMRRFGRNTLHLADKGTAKSYWQPRPRRGSESKRAFRQF